MSAKLPRRVEKELIECQKSQDTSDVYACRFSNDSDKILGTIKGPVGTPYEGGIFKLLIQYPESYPFEPPKIKFETKIWHPNISSQTGAICLDILKDQWSPALTTKTALLSIQALLSAAEPNDPQDAEVAKMYLSNYKTFEKTAKFWTESYAKPVEHDTDMSVLQGLLDMGFPMEMARKALTDNGGDQNAALETLLRGT